MLGGLSLSERIQTCTPTSRSPNPATGEESEEGEGTTLFAIRGTSDDGIVQCISDVFPRLQGAYAEYDSFQSRSLAQQWINEFQFFAVKFTDGSTEVVMKNAIMRMTRGKRGVQVHGPCARHMAEEQVRKWDSDVSSSTRHSGPVVRRAAEEWLHCQT